MHWQILVQFVFRMAFGLAAAMALTSASQVTSGFFRVHLWVTMGLNTFLAALLWFLPEYPQQTAVWWCALAGAVMSYFGAVMWLYERPRAGWWCLVIVVLINLVGALLGLSWSTPGWAMWVQAIDRVSGGLLLGVTLAAMFLGHWYLNTPTMRLEPLQRLVAGMAGAGGLRAILAAGGLIATCVVATPAMFHSPFVWGMLAMRWLSGLLGLLVMAWMTWQTLKIPNTQSATGILYVAVIFVFLGELTSQFLSSQTVFPV